jgi:alpha-N-arabinofuranosidase
MIAISDDIRGPYISNPRNPILSSRHLSYDYWVNSTGHADLVELSDGRWYMVTLGIRGDEERRSNMGRETHLVPVIWEKEPFEWQEIKHEWPVCAPKTGRIERKNPVPFSNTSQYRNDVFYDNFDSGILALQWNFRRVPEQESYSLNANKGHLRLYASSNSIRDRAQYSFMGIRQRESDFEYEVCMKFNPEEDSIEAGVCLLQQDDNYLKFTIIKENGQKIIQLELKEPATEPRFICRETINYSGEIVFRIISKSRCYHYYFSNDNCESYQVFAETRATHILSKGYTGAYLGVFATSNGKLTRAYADFDWVQYKSFQRV